MDQLIDAIRAATAPDATTEAKATGAQACRTILAALDSVPGRPIALPGTPPQPPLADVSIDQVLDMVIARLTTIANERDKTASPSGPPPNGLRVPMAAARPRAIARPTSAARPTNAARPAPTRKP